MTAKEMAEILRKASDILYLLDDLPISNALDEIYKATKHSLKKTKLKEEKVLLGEGLQREYDLKVDDQLIPLELIDKMQQMSNGELVDFLKEEPLFQTKNGLLLLAKKLSLSTSPRNSVTSLMHNIMKYFERQRLDRIIGKERVSED